MPDANISKAQRLLNSSIKAETIQSSEQPKPVQIEQPFDDDLAKWTGILDAMLQQ